MSNESSSRYSAAELDKLFELSKHDHAMFVGSEIRTLIAMARNSIAPRSERGLWKQRAHYIAERSGNSDAAYFGINSTDEDFEKELQRQSERNEP